VGKLACPWALSAAGASFAYKPRDSDSPRSWVQQSYHI